MYTQAILPRHMYIGGHAIMQLAPLLKELHLSKVLIVTDHVMCELGYCQQITDYLKAEGIKYGCFTKCIPEPTAISIQEGVSMAQDGQYDAIIALGGGSPIDSAKAIAVLAKHGGKIQDYKFPHICTKFGLPIIAIPTTAGTGSEVTRFTIITDETCDEKMLCVGSAFMPHVAIIDYQLTLSLPPRITADTGLDALTHAIEAYVSKKSSPYTDSQALSAMQLIAPNLRTVFHEGGNESAREAMMLGATLAGIAFSNASVALVHGMSRPIGAFFHVPHGLSNAMLLPSITSYSLPAAKERYAQAAKAMGVADHADTNDQATQKLLVELKALNKELAVPSLNDFGITRDEFFSKIPIMAQQALDSGSPSNNPRIPSLAEIKALYAALWQE